MAEATQHNLKITMKCFKGLKACKKIKMVDGHKNFSKAKMSNKFSVLTPKKLNMNSHIFFADFAKKSPSMLKWNHHQRKIL